MVVYLSCSISVIPRLLQTEILLDHVCSSRGLSLLLPLSFEAVRVRPCQPHLETKVHCIHQLALPLQLLVQLLLP